MATVGTFGGFTIARLGIYAAQKALDVTGHNITNINTPGYTRQRLDQMSLNAGLGDRYVSKYNVNNGNGVLLTGVSQLRDPFLDIRYRNERSSVGAMDGKLSGLEDLQRALDEVAKGDGAGVLEKQFNELRNRLENLQKDPSAMENDGIARDAAKQLITTFNSLATQLQQIKDNQAKGFDQDLNKVNGILKDIANLNDNIFKSEIHGDNALEMRDQRNLLIDELSKYVKIDVTYKPVNVGAGKTVDSLTISLAGTPKGGPNARAELVNGSYATELSIRDVPAENRFYDPADPTSLPYLDADGNPTGNLAQALIIKSPNFDLDLGPLTDAKQNVMAGSTVKQLGDMDLFGSLQSTREILTEAGEFSTNQAVGMDGNATSKRGVPYYQNALDSLARQFAETFNQANTGYLEDLNGNFVSTDGTALVYIENDGTQTPLTNKTVLTQDYKDYLKANGVELGGVLFSKDGTGDDSTGITAANISISKKWSIGETRILNSRIMGTKTPENAGEPVKPNSGANDNISHLLVMFDGKQEYRANDIRDQIGNVFEGNTVFFKGNFQEMLGSIHSTLANDIASTSSLLNNYVASANEIDYGRSSVSGVDLNDEATNMMQYQKSYAAACRLMTAMDEALEKLINGTGVVGR